MNHENTLSPTSSAPASWRFFLSPGEAWDMMYWDCQAAQHSIDLEQYIFMPDAMGERFAALFEAKARAGVRVRLILDKYGSISFFFSGRAKKLQEAGVELQFFNPLAWSFTRFSRWLPRTHAKTLIIDSRVLYTGGVCIDATMRDWRDTHIRLEGPVVAQGQQEFEHAWQGEHRYTLPREYLKNRDDFYFIASASNTPKNAIYHQLKRNIRNARHRVLLVSPFFIPTRGLRRALCRAARRGVQVELMIPERSDVPLADYVTQAYLGRVMRRGVKVWLYQRSVLHAKVAVVDDWATVGSMNVDHLSMVRNRENNVIIRDRAAVEELVQQFESDLTCCTPLTLRRWQHRPWLRKLLGRYGRRFKKVL